MKRAFLDLTNAYLKAVEGVLASLPLGSDSVPLDRVYVRLEALASPKPRPLESRPDLPEVPERQEHAGLADLPGAESPPSPSPQPLSEVLAAARHLSLLGEPGSGKSTTLQFIGLCFARPGWAKEKLALDEPGVPVLVKLGEVGDRLQPIEARLLDDVVMPIIRGLLPQGTTEAETQDVVMEWMTQGRLLLLDGLDEGSGEAIRQKIALFASDPKGRRCRIVLSSRPSGYSSPGSDFREYRLKPFEKPEEARSYLQGWLATLRPEWEPQAENKARALLDEMSRNPALKRITDNPLLLRLAAEGYAADGQVARSRGDLYRRYVEIVAWQQRESTREASSDQKAAALATLETIAWKLQQGSRIPWDGADPQQVLLRRQLGLLVIYNDAGKAYLTFSHTTFREYFLARHLAKAWQQKDSRTRAWAILEPRLHDPTWREPLLLLSGMLKKETATDLVQRVLKAHSQCEKELLRDLRLAAAMANECGEEKLKGSLWKELQWQLRVKILQMSIDAIKEIGGLAVLALLQWLEDKNERGWAVEALGKIGDPQAIPALLQALKDEHMNARWKVAKALGEIGDPQAVPALLLTLKDKDQGVRQSATGALGKIGDPQAVPALLQTLKDEDEDVRDATALALGDIGAPATPVLLRALKDKDQGVRQSATGALGKIGDPQAVPALLQTLKDEDEDVRDATALALGDIGAPATPVLLRALKDKDQGVRRWAVAALGKIGDPQVVPALLQALKDKDQGVRRWAVAALGKISDPQVVPALLQALKDEDQGVRQSAVAALGKISDPQVVPALLQALKDEDQGVRQSATGALGEIGDPQAVPALLLALKDKDEDVRWWAVETLGEIGTPAVPALLQALKDEDQDMRVWTAKALEEIGDPHAVPALLQALKDEDQGVRQSATGALGEIGDPQAVPALLQALKDEDQDMRVWAAVALGKIGDPQAVPALLLALNDQDGNVRRLAAEALGEIGDPQAVPALLQTLKDGDDEMRWSAVEALGEIGDPQVVPALLWALDRMPESSATILGKIGGKVEDIPTLKDIIASLRRVGEWNELEIVVNYLDALQAGQHSLPDPLIVPPVPGWQQSLARFGRGVAWAVVTVILGWVLLFSDALGDLLKAQWGTTLKTWATGNPGWLVGLVTLVIFIGGLLALGVDALKKK